MVLSDSWHFLKIHDKSWRSITFLDSTLWFMTIHDSSFKMIHVDPWHFLTFHDNSLQLMTSDDNGRHFIIIYDKWWGFKTNYKDKDSLLLKMSHDNFGWFMIIHGSLWWDISVDKIYQAGKQAPTIRISLIHWDPIGFNLLLR